VIRKILDNHMGQTIVEKSLATHTGCAVVRPGEFIAARGDLILISPGAAAAIPDAAIIRIDLNRGLITAGGLVPYVRDRLAGERGPTAR
jgi:hypothetical protein